jgi:hypothetical protein
MQLSDEHRERSRDRSRVRIAVLSALGLLIVGATAFVAWTLTPLGPSSAALDALVSDDSVTVSAFSEGWLFEPGSPATPSRGLVLYPGGRVDPRSYAPLARQIAERGYTVALASMPLNLAVIDPGRADTLIGAAPDVERWAVGGHSLGGAMAAAYATSPDERVTGLLLLAAYPAESTELDESGLAALSIIGTEDGVVDREVWTAAIDRLPAGTTYLTLDGADHAQFGDYGNQPGDRSATISRAEQQRLTADAAVSLLERL